jgi:hypothetical protein
MFIHGRRTVQHWSLPNLGDMGVRRVKASDPRMHDECTQIQLVPGTATLFASVITPPEIHCYAPFE